MTLQPYNPSSIVVSDDEIEHDPLDQADYEAIISYFARTRHAEWLLLTRILRATGLREAEVMRLTTSLVEHNGPETHLLVIRGKQRLKDGKRPKYERVALLYSVAMELDAYIASHRLPPEWPIFQHKARAYQYAFNKACLAATGSAHHPHELRGLYCVDLLEQGQPLAVVSKMLGHSSEATTLKYYNRLTSKQRNQINQGVRA